MFRGRFITLSLWLAISVLSNLICLPAQLNETPQQKGVLNFLKLINKGASNAKNGSNFASTDVTTKCQGLPAAGPKVDLYNEDGSIANPQSDHSVGTVIYPKCRPGTSIHPRVTDYPNVKEARCNENGKWSVDFLDCYTCSYSKYPETLSYPLLEVTRSNLKVICDVHFISPYLIETAASCFKEPSTTDYYVYVNNDVAKIKGESTSSFKFIKITKVHYQNGEEKTGNHLALAELESRLTLDNDRSFVCLDWANFFDHDVQPGDSGWVTPITTGENSHLEPQNHPWKSCTDLDSRPVTFTSNEGCVDLDHSKYEMRKGAAFYMPYNGVYYLRAITTDTSLTPSYKAILTSTAQYWQWIKDTITATNRDYPNIVNAPKH